MKKVAVVLSGCGYLDGSEITEAVSTLIALSEVGAQYEVFAPDLNAISKNHLSHQTHGDRNALHESARIARGHVQPLRELRPTDFDAIAFPGGYGAATILCRFAEQGANCEVLPDVALVLESFYRDEKPILAICIAPALVARVLGKKGITLTIGNDAKTAKEVEKTGAHHQICDVSDYVTDREHKIVSTPAYMYDKARPHEVFTGIRLAVREFYALA